MCGSEPKVAGKSYCETCWETYLAPWVAGSVQELEGMIATEPNAQLRASLRRIKAQVEANTLSRCRLG